MEYKNSGKTIIAGKRNAQPALCPPMFGFTIREKQVMRSLEKVEKDKPVTTETGE